ncbi:hypothetical protein KO481_34535 [Nocardia sp. NEAU-G5]|uniref:Uncharacterized protein n=1 Tax=Nocardia albiluteola TaxID=2842303 RepID=A0ABS6B8J5_9NOCA|nr:hypothetical protein [Nocardia albiluteola]MBU3066622.1 hypothetical protein [Nocardia albiluteola]
MFRWWDAIAIAIAIVRAGLRSAGGSYRAGAGHGRDAAAPPALSRAWAERVAAALVEALNMGAVSLERVARRLATSPRTLQRRLTEAGTAWRQELDRARLRRATAAGPLSRSRQA